MGRLRPQLIDVRQIGASAGRETATALLARAAALQGRPGKTGTGSTMAAEAAHVLVVDDDPRVRAMLARHLKGEGFRVGEATDGAAMRACLARELPDLVL